MAPKAPGTAGTLAAIPIYLLIANCPAWLYLILLVIGLFVGVWWSQSAIHFFQKKDPPEVVWDEIIGFLVTMFMAPSGWLWIVVGFLLFRLFDIWKPWPVRWADRCLTGGWGIMLDDVIAGIYAAIILQLLAISFT
ncbi:Phosphatidylglycerophosphatase A [Methylophaga frappieri]|uniref:Phosphatidylglycerophosphatase A n=1 Tax=Methylophaga frappieri (strain ATCC BAA-2434 / DSM 25690 / JAM7) TaxID=754477 RepID=I1YGM5_METFJ|nr:Phosphatidylglycerophosphatase A [Methylophaga frappieri]